MPLVVADVETTGLGHHANPARADGVVQVGLAWKEKDRRIRRWSSYCNPGGHFLEGGRAEAALRINGLTVNAVLNSKPVKEVASEFWEKVRDIENSSGSEVTIKSFNRRFDQGFLDKPPWKVPEELWGDCIMLDAQRHLGLYKWPKLEEAMSALGLRWPEGKAHDAGVDAHAALLVHDKIH